MTKSKLYMHYADKCFTSIEKIDASLYGSSDNKHLKLIIYRPKTLKFKTKYPCIIYAYGGGACMLDASVFDAIVCRMA